MPCLSESKRSTFKWAGLNFVGTLGQWASPSPIERLKDPEALGTWLREAGLLAPAQTSEADLALARRLREAIHQLGVQRLETKPLGGRNLAGSPDCRRPPRPGWMKPSSMARRYPLAQRPAALVQHGTLRQPGKSGGVPRASASRDERQAAPTRRAILAYRDVRFVLLVAIGYPFRGRQYASVRGRPS